METANPIFRHQISADVIALDKQGRVILVADVRGSRVVKLTLPQFTSYLKATQTVVPFAMLVDPETIQIVQWDGVNWSEAICSLKTTDVVNYYDPSCDNQTIDGDYLEALIESWLRDLAYHWKSVTPPVTKELAAIGLLQQLEDGSTKSDVEIAGDTLLGDQFFDEYLYWA